MLIKNIFYKLLFKTFTNFYIPDITHITTHLLQTLYKIPQNSNEKVVFAYFILNYIDVVCFFK